MHRAFSFGHAPFSFPDSALIVCWSNRTANLLTSGSIPHAWHDPHDTLAVSIAPNGIGVARMTFYHWAGALPHWHPVRFRGLNSIVRNDAKLRHQVYRDPQPHACVARVIFSTIHTRAPVHTSSHVVSSLNQNRSIRLGGKISLLSPEHRSPSYARAAP